MYSSAESTPRKQLPSANPKAAAVRPLNLNFLEESRAVCRVDSSDVLEARSRDRNANTSALGYWSGDGSSSSSSSSSTSSVRSKRHSEAWEKKLEDSVAATRMARTESMVFAEAEYECNSARALPQRDEVQNTGEFLEEVKNSGGLKEHYGTEPHQLSNGCTNSEKRARKVRREVREGVMEEGQEKQKGVFSRRSYDSLVGKQPIQQSEEPNMSRAQIDVRNEFTPPCFRHDPVSIAECAYNANSGEVTINTYREGNQSDPDGRKRIEKNRVWSSTPLVPCRTSADCTSPPAGDTTTLQRTRSAEEKLISDLPSLSYFSSGIFASTVLFESDGISLHGGTFQDLLAHLSVKKEGTPIQVRITHLYLQSPSMCHLQ